MRLILPKWYDLHVHLRQGAAMEAYIADHLAMGCCGVLAMPNTKPPVGKILKDDPLPYWSIEEYRTMALATGGGKFSHIITPLYLTKDTSPVMIHEGVSRKLLQACKYYPPHGTTNADHGIPMDRLMDSDILKAMEELGVILCIHGEQHGLSGAAYFDKATSAEDVFYRETMPRLRERYPDLKIVCEHITTRTAVDFVKNSGDKTGATITPQHLLYTVADLIQGLKYHLYCLPLVKFDEDRGALRAAVNDAGNRRFFAGTDSAPHAAKVTECGCAAGCYTGGVAPQLYADSFDFNEGQDNFERFLCLNGPSFYDLPVPTETFTLEKKPIDVKPTITKEGTILPLPLGLAQKTLNWSIVDA